MRFGTVLADAGYGTSAVFRHGLDARGLTWAVGIARNQKVYGVTGNLSRRQAGPANLGRVRSRARPRAW